MGKPVVIKQKIDEGLTKGEVKKWAMQYRGEYENTYTDSTFIVNRETISHSVNHQRRGTSDKIAIFSDIDKIIEVAVPLGGVRERNSVFYYSPVVSELGEGLVRIVAKPFKEGLKVHAYDVRYKKNSTRRASALSDKSDLHRLSSAENNVKSFEHLVKELFPDDFKGNDQGDMGDTSFSLGRSEMVDALNKSIYERVKDPELKAAALFETASKLEELRRDRDEIKSLFGKKVNVRALRDPIKKSELMKQYRVMRDSLMQDYVNTALKEHDFITEKLDEEFPLSELKEAKAAIREAEKRARNEAKEWLDSEWEKVKKDNSPLKKVQRNLEMLDAILIALPTHLRGKIKGVKTLSKMSNDEKALEYLQEKINEAGDLLENDAIKQDLQKQFDEKLMELPTHLRGKIRGAKTLASIYIFGDR